MGREDQAPSRADLPEAVRRVLWMELRAMYGGLQAGIGALAILGAVRPGLLRPALLALLFLGAGLGLARLLAAPSAGELSGYTAFALVFEGATAIVAALLLRGAEPQLREGFGSDPIGDATGSSEAR